MERGSEINKLIKIIYENFPTFPVKETKTIF